MTGHFYRFFYDSVRSRGGERERENGKSARIILLATQGKAGRGNTLCVYYAGITRVIKGLLTCWNTRVAMVDRRYLSIY